MADTILNVEIRSNTGKGVARKLRAAGRIPGNCYGKDQSASISVDPRELDNLIKRSAAGMNTLIDLKVVGGGAFDGKKVLLKEMQRDPVSNEALHADFFALDLTHTIEVAVPVHPEGTPKGVKLEGGILDHPLREIHLECLPNAIPEEILVDVSHLEIGMSIHVRDIVLPKGVELQSDGDLTVFSVLAPKVIEEEVAVEAEEGVDKVAAADKDKGDEDEDDKSERS